MGHDEDDGLWDEGVQDFIEACKHEQLVDISLGYSVIDDRRQILKVSALYRSRFRGLVPIGYRWADRPKLGWVPNTGPPQVHPCPEWGGHAVLWFGAIGK